MSTGFDRNFDPSSIRKTIADRERMEAAINGRDTSLSDLPKMATQLDSEYGPVRAQVQASVVAEHFLRQGEVMAKALEESAAFHEDTAKQYRELAASSREVAKQKAKEADEHEQTISSVRSLLKT